MQDLVATFIPLMIRDKNNVRLGYTQLLREAKVLVPFLILNIKMWGSEHDF